MKVIKLFHGFFSKYFNIQIKKGDYSDICNHLKSLFNKYNLNQLYRHYVKELFIYNRYWSNRELFFGNKKNNKLKYKQLTYYTRNYQQPILYPILEFDRNYPKFSNYTDNMFINSLRLIKMMKIIKLMKMMKIMKLMKIMKKMK